MPNISNTSQINQPVQMSCCGTTAKTTDWVKKVDLICRVALAVFSAAIAPVFFGAAFGTGIILGTAYTALRYLQKKPLLSPGDTRPICAQGFMDYLSGMRFPPVVNSLVTAIFIGAHVRHDPAFFAPFVGVFVGFWLGREGANVAGDLGGRAISLFQPDF